MTTSASRSDGLDERLGLGSVGRRKWSSVRVRPYILTGGRTTPTVEFPVEAQVRPRPLLHRPEGLSPAQNRVLDLVTVPLAVAEVAARADVPLPVARVLIADLIELDAVAVDTVSPGDRPDIKLLRKVLEGLHSL